MGKNTRIMKWIKSKLMGLAIAISNVEKNIFSQEKKQVGINKIVNNEKKTLMQSLKDNEITEEVKDLRWRMYKILRHANNSESKVESYIDGVPVLSIKKYDSKRALSKVMIDSFDNYKLELVIDNTPIVLSGIDVISNDNIVQSDVIINYDEETKETSATHGEISNKDYTNIKGESPIIVTRDLIPKFEIENFTKKLNVRAINETEKLLEFYISKYPDNDNRHTSFLISDIKKAIENPRMAAFLEIKTVSFVTYNSVGKEDFYEYEYEVKSLDKIIEYNGFYVIKYKANVIVDGLDILEEYKQAGLEEKYNKIEKRH